MGVRSQVTANCIHCGHAQAVDTFLSVNVAEEPELRDRVRDGSLFLWECEACGGSSLVRSSCLYHDPGRKLMIWLLEGGAVDEAKLAATADELPDYTLRRVSDVGSLIEKVKIFDASLDDRVMEMCKWVSRQELADSMPEQKPEILAAPFKFFRMEGADNDLILSFPLDGKMMSVRVGFHVYEDCRGILQRHADVLSSLRGFARVDADWIASLMR